jgi:putative transposase
MSEMTSVLRTVETTKLTRWWLAFSHLDGGKPRIQLPLVPSPYITHAAQAGKGILARKTKRGLWRFEVVDPRKWDPPELKPSMPRIGVDVGLNVAAATSDGRLLGATLKPKFDRRYQQVKNVRANRQQQGLPENSSRLDRLEIRLSGLIKTLAGEAANALVRAYPAHAFVIEDLDLRGCRGQKRMAYRALHHNLMTKAPCIAVNPAYTSQACPSCGFVARKNRHGIDFACKFCGRRSHADVVGAQNLLRRSEDEKVARVDHPSEVRPILNARHEAWRARHASLCASGRRTRAPVPSGPRLTTGVPRGTGKASNQVLHPTEQV